MGEVWEDFGGGLAGKFRRRTRDMLTIRRGAGANSGGNNGPVFYGRKSNTNGGYAQQTRSPGLDETTADRQSSQCHGGEVLRFRERDPARITEAANYAEVFPHSPPPYITYKMGMELAY